MKKSSSPKKHARNKITSTAKAMLDGEISYIEGSRIILRLLRTAQVPILEKPFITFVGIESETELVPIGDALARWHPDAVIRFEQEWANAEVWAKVVGEPACKEIIECLE